VAVELVWNKGIASQCDRRIPDEFPDGRTYCPVPTLAGVFSSPKLPDNLISEPAAYTNVRDGELIWVRVSWLRSFVKQVLPLVKSKFVLVTADSDSSVPSELVPEARSILGHRNILHWYAQNCDGSMAPERISPIPIGVDLHSLGERPIWGERQSTPFEQEQALQSIRKCLPRLENRIPKVYVDFAWQPRPSLRDYLRLPPLRHRLFHPLNSTRFREARQQIAKKVRRNALVYCQTGSLPRNELWRARGEFAFVLSPHGMGLDCHRTWEALALGHIVLVPSSGLNRLYDGLAVVILKSWSDITVQNLQQWLSLHRDWDGVHEKLRNSYWIRKMGAMTNEPTPLTSQ
jgi:hypothetical protein